MGAVSTGIAVGALVVGAYSARQQQIQQNRAARQQRKAQRVQENQQKASAAAQRRQKVREERVRKAQIRQAASSAGVGGSSGEVGAITALSTNVDTSLAASRGAQQTASQISELNQKISKAQQLAGEHGAVANLAFSVAQFSANQRNSGGGN